MSLQLRNFFNSQLSVLQPFAQYNISLECGYLLIFVLYFTFQVVQNMRDEESFIVQMVKGQCLHEASAANISKINTCNSLS